MWQAHLETSNYSGSRILRRKSLKIAVRLPLVTRKQLALSYRHVASECSGLCSFSCCSICRNRPSLADVMAERSIVSDDGEEAGAPITSTPLVESIYQRRRKRRLENYLAGTGRAVHVDRELQRSLSSNESSMLSGEELTVDTLAKRQKRAVECSRGCPAVLKNLSKTFDSVGRHCWPTRMYRQNAFPSPASNSSTENYRNIVGTEHPWIRRICIFLDNASSTNKNKYLFAWGMEIVSQSRLSFLRFSFMPAGHT